jgi:hypothetical protein
MRGGDAGGDRETEAGAAGFGCDERIEDMLKELCRDP